MKSIPLSRNTTVRDWPARDKMLVLAGTAATLIIFALLSASPARLVEGLYQIVIHPDVLLVDYIAIGGLGGAFLNSGLVTILITFILWKLKDPFNGITIAAVLTVAGFSFLGKNILNIWPILIGVWIYSRLRKEPYGKVIYSGLFGTAMAPIVTEAVFHLALPMPVRILLGAGLGILIGIILPPLAAHFSKAGQGFNLYNVGFVAGLLLTAISATFMTFGYEASPQAILETGYHRELAIFLYSFSGLILLLGLLGGPQSLQSFKQILKRSGQAPSDFITLEGASGTFINMGLTGIIAITYLLLVGGQISGVMIAPIFTIIGFAAFGKHSLNILPILIGVAIGGFHFWDLSAPVILFAALFGTALAPIAGTYGWPWGILAGFLHTSLVRQTGAFHAGLNLYNNGFSAGIIAMIMVPILDAFIKPRPICESVSQTPHPFPVVRAIIQRRK